MRPWAARLLGIMAAAALLPACHQNVTLSAVLTSADRVDLSWTSGAVAGFTVERSTSGGAFVPLASLPGAARAWTDSAPPGGAVRDYRLQVRGFDGSVHATAPTRVATPWAATYGAAGDEDALSLSVLPDGGLGWPSSMRPGRPSGSTPTTRAARSFPPASASRSAS